MCGSITAVFMRDELRIVVRVLWYSFCCNYMNSKPLQRLEQESYLYILGMLTNKYKLLLTYSVCKFLSIVLKIITILKKAISGHIILGNSRHILKKSGLSLGKRS